MATSENLGAIGSGGDFGGFEAADFDAYDRAKWGSNAFTLQRRRAKDRLLALARAVQRAEIATLGELELGASDEAPSVANGRKVQAQWAFFTRGAAERASLKTLLSKMDLGSAASLFDISVQHQHACLFLRVDQAGLAIGVELATKARVDREHAARKLEPRWARERLVELLRALPAGSVVQLGDSARDVGDETPETIEAWLPELAGRDRVLSIESRVARTDPELAGPGFAEVARTLTALHAPILRHLAWAREHDAGQVKEALQKEKKVREERAAAGFEAGARVTILSGLFAGRAGYVAEVAKGKAKVMVGPVSVTVELKDLRGA